MTQLLTGKALFNRLKSRACALKNCDQIATTSISDCIFEKTGIRIHKTTLLNLKNHDGKPCSVYAKAYALFLEIPLDEIRNETISSAVERAYQKKKSPIAYGLLKQWANFKVVAQ